MTALAIIVIALILVGVVAVIVNFTWKRGKARNLLHGIGLHNKEASDLLQNLRKGKHDAVTKQISEAQEKQRTAFQK